MPDFEPNVEVPVGYAKTWDAGEACVEIVRGRLEGLGPIDGLLSIAASLGVARRRSMPRLIALQAEGFAMRGRFTPGVQEDEWCERRLLARIHRYTVKRLRAEIEPVQARDFLRFLFEWQRVIPEARMQGPDAVAAVLAQLEGFEAPASAWETEILPARIAEYEPAWLDEHCLAGRFVWSRLATRKADPERGAAPVRSTPITLLARRNVKTVVGIRGSARSGAPHRRPRATSRNSSRRKAHRSSMRSWKALRLLPTQAEDALAELVALGTRQLRQFRRPARIARAVGAKIFHAQRTPSAARLVRNGRCRALGARAPARRHQWQSDRE